ncbi:phosphoribosyl-ATP pyrophosphohydrolase [Candidatus Dojkabacteria bacterium]|nr:phosphoribosyl-ATP pyrophosphohydrolase [Candidatus Dojkabacteria bacterium]
MNQKLVRDKIPEIIRGETGKEPKIHIAKEREFKNELKKKLLEEVDEFFEDFQPEELADILEVLIKFSKVIGTDLKDIERIRMNKKKNRGGFEKRIILEQ